MCKHACPPTIGGARPGWSAVRMGLEPNETGGWSRRKWVKVMAAAAAIGAAGAVGALALRSLLGPPAEVRGQIREAFHYTRYDGADVWWKDLEDQPMKV